MKTRGRNFGVVWPEDGGKPHLLHWLAKNPLIVPGIPPKKKVGAKIRDALSLLPGVNGTYLHNNVNPVRLPGVGLLAVGHAHTDVPDDAVFPKGTAPKRRRIAAFGMTYVHYFVLLDEDPPFRAIAQSPPLCFLAAAQAKVAGPKTTESLCETIQFISGLTLLPGGTELAVGYGINDCEAAVSVLPVDWLVRWIRGKRRA